MQLVQRKEQYLAIAKALPTDNPMEIAERNNITKMVKAVFFPYKCGDLLSAQQDVAKWVRWKLVGLIGEWRQRMGAIKGVTAQQMEVEAKYVVDYFSDVTIAEFKWAMDMYTTGEISFEFNMFSCQFMSNVLQEMMAIKQRQQRILVDKIPLKEKKATLKEKAESMQYMIEEVKKQIDEKKYQIIMIGDVFNYLRRTEKLSITDEMIVDGKKYAEAKIATGKKSSPKKTEFKTMKAMMESGFSGDNKESLHRDFANEYCLMEYFRENDLKKILASVTEKDFS